MTDTTMAEVSPRELARLLDTVLARLGRIEDLLKPPRDRTPAPQEWFSISDAAALVGLSTKHLRRALTGGTLPASNVGTPDRPLYRISRAELSAWMEKRKAGALPPPRKKKDKAGPPVSRHARPAHRRAESTAA